MRNIVDILQKRHEISLSYCEEKGWDAEHLSFDQMLEIRKLPEWKNAGQEDRGKLGKGLEAKTDITLEVKKNED